MRTHARTLSRQAGAKRSAWSRARQRVGRLGKEAAGGGSEARSPISAFVPAGTKGSGEAADGAKAGEEAEAAPGLQKPSSRKRREGTTPRSGALRRATEAYLAGASRASKGVTQGGKHMPAAIAAVAAGASARILKDVAGKKAADKRIQERIPAASTTPRTSGSAEGRPRRRVARRGLALATRG